MANLGQVSYALTLVSHPDIFPHDARTQHTVYHQCSGHDRLVARRLREMLNGLPDDRFEYRIVKPDALADELTNAF